MFKVLDVVLLLGAAIFCVFVFTGFILLFIQARWPAVEEKLQRFFNSKFGMVIFAIIGIWGTSGVIYTVTFY